MSNPNYDPDYDFDHVWCVYFVDDDIKMKGLFSTKKKSIDYVEKLSNELLIVLSEPTFVNNNMYFEVKNGTGYMVIIRVFVAN